MPNNNHIEEFEAPTDWLALFDLLKNGAISGVGGYVAVEFIKTIFESNIDYEGLIKSSITEISEKIKKSIDNAFLREYIADCNYVKEQLQIYGNTKEKTIIFFAQDHASKLVNRIESFGVPAFGGLMLACNLHLLTLRAISQIPEENSFKSTLEMFCKSYADKLEKVSKNYFSLNKEHLEVRCIPFSQTNGSEPFAFALIKPGSPLRFYELSKSKECNIDAEEIKNQMANEDATYRKCMDAIASYRVFKVPETI